ncbi:MAG: type II toxin-antitoxin system RelE/ParE family toxin [Nanoarchaeota archaeon]
MVIVAFDEKFKKIFSKIKDNSVRERIIKQIQKIKENPEIGKPMRFSRKGTRELYIPPFRLSYAYFIPQQKIIILELYHKNEQ